MNIGRRVEMRIRDSFPIRGFTLLDVSASEEDDHYVLVFRVEDDSSQLGIALHLPKPDKDGVYDIEGINKVIVQEGRRSVDYPKHPNRTSSIWVRSQDEIIVDLIAQALDATLVSAVHRHPAAEQMGQQVIDDFFATSPLVRQVDTDKLLDLELTKDLVHLNVSEGSLDVEDRRIKDWAGILDLTTIPQGSKALQTFRLAGGAKVEKKRFVRGHRLLCSVMDRCTIFPENTRPARTLLTRSAFAKHEELLVWEDPLVAHHTYQSGDLRGVHLLTAFTPGKYNYSDCIMVSQSAAQKMACYRRVSQSITDTHPIDVVVNYGDEVDPEDHLMVIRCGVDEDGEPEARTVRASKIHKASRVVRIDKIRTHIIGEPAERVRIKFECVYGLHDGDKITSRHGTKGVVRVVPDNDMPRVLNEHGEFVQIEVIIHPLSLVGRRSLGVFREMMANQYALQCGEPLRVEHLSDEQSTQELAAMGFGEKRLATLRGRELPRPVYAAPMYWIRLDHHAREQSSACGPTKPLNFVGTNPDAGKVSGQRINLGVATVMHAKELEATHAQLHEANVEEGAVRLTRDLMSVLAFSGQASRRRLGD
jgi:hypothetical protein